MPTLRQQSWHSRVNPKDIIKNISPSLYLPGNKLATGKTYQLQIMKCFLIVERKKTKRGDIKL